MEDYGDDMAEWNWKGLFCLFCWPPCPRIIAAKIAFIPPSPTYTFKEENARLTIWPTEHAHSYLRYTVNSNQNECHHIRSSRRNKIACVYVAGKGAPEYTLLLSHGNAVDIGQVLDLYKHLAAHLKCNLMVYDYSGFGMSTGKPSEKNLYADINTAWNLLRTNYQTPPEKIVLFGQSIGTVPTVDLASRELCGGVVLQSPLTSGMRVVFPNWRRRKPFDVFNNIAKVNRIRAPVLVIHGTDDTVIDISHGLDIFERCPNTVPPLWLQGAGHNNIESYPEYFERLKYFIKDELPITKPLPEIPKKKTHKSS